MSDGKTAHSQPAVLGGLRQKGRTHRSPPDQEIGISRGQQGPNWYIGVLAGAVRYGDFDVVSGGGSGSGSTNKIDTSGAFGAQTAVDIAIGSNDRWGVNIGIKYLESKIEPEDPTLNTVQVDPVNYRVMAVFRF